LLCFAQASVRAGAVLAFFKIVSSSLVKSYPAKSSFSLALRRNCEVGFVSIGTSIDTNLFGDGSSCDGGGDSSALLWALDDLVVLGVLVLPPAWTDPVGDFPWDASELTSLAWVLMVTSVNDVAWCGRFAFILDFTNGRKRVRIQSPTESNTPFWTTFTISTRPNRR
jgi:hypothetical protein